jgi:hypothetical protein
MLQKAGEQRGIYMKFGLVVIFLLVTLLALVATFRTLKEKNMLGVVFSAAALFVFGFFTIMTIIYNGYPPAH